MAIKLLREHDRIINRVLYGVIALKFDTYVEAGREIGVPENVLISAVKDGRIPFKKNRYKILNYYGIPEEILFNKEDIEKRKAVALKNNGIIDRNFYDYEYPIKGAPFVEYGCIGVKKPRFRVPTKGMVRRPVLYAVLIAENITVSEFASFIGISGRNGRSYIYDTVYPKTHRISIIENLLNFSIEHLFYEVDDFDVKNFEED